MNKTEDLTIDGTVLTACDPIFEAVPLGIQNGIYKLTKVGPGLREQLKDPDVLEFYNQPLTQKAFSDAIDRWRKQKRIK
jgi:hypothetical protein